MQADGVCVAPRVTMSAEMMAKLWAWAECAPGMMVAFGATEKQADGTLHVSDVMLPLQRASTLHVDPYFVEVPYPVRFMWCSRGEIGVFTSDTDRRTDEDVLQANGDLLISATVNRSRECAVRLHTLVPRATLAVTIEVVGEAPDLAALQDLCRRDVRERVHPARPE